jgi:preprotein translocase subunit YajC
VYFLIILVVLFGAMWVFLIRPQKRRQAEQARLQRSVAAGDEILTAGGIHGTVRSVEDEVVQVEIAAGTIIRLDLRAVAAVLQEPEPEAEIEAEPVDPVSRGGS